MRLVAALLFSVLAYAAVGSVNLERGIREVELDPAECYRVHDVQLNKDDIHLYFTDGYLIFGKPIEGVRTVAVFTADVEAGDAELLLLPTDRSERRSLAVYTGSPNLDEHLDAAVLLFGDNTYADLMQQIHANEFNRPKPEMGALMAYQWHSVVRNLSSSFEARLLLDLLSPRRGQQGDFIAAINGKKLGSFDVVYEPRAPEQIIAGQVASRNNRTFFDIWTSFEASPYRKGVRKAPTPELSLKDYRIEATLEPNLLLRVVTKVKMTVADAGERVLPFDMTARMQVSSATIDGEPAEVLQPESLRSNLIRNNGNSVFLIVAPHALEAGRDYEVEFHHEGAVVEDAGHQVYYVGARGTWYPNFGMEFARYDLTFRYPQGLDLVTPGDVVSDTTEGEWRITRRVTQVPIRFAGFNLGVYKRARVTRNGYTVEVCANRALEEALQRKVPIPPIGGHVGNSKFPAAASATTQPLAEPPARIEDLAAEVAATLEFMTARFGPPPLKTLEVSPIPGGFGQGFPGLLYLSTMAYLRREDEALARLDRRQQSFFIDLLQAHETAHQWWGNLVSPAGYRDNWLMESLANYSALLYLEKRDGRSTVDAALESYRGDLLTKDEKGQTSESAGPIVLGTRLESSQSLTAWNTITYGKGSWILHMLRSQMGDDRFAAMLGELRRRYEGKTISTDQFRQLAAEYLPPGSPDPKLENFFEQWVYGTGIPGLRLSYSVHGRAPAIHLTGSVSQSDVDPDFSVQVPLDIECGSARQVKWVRTSSSPAEFTIALKQQPTKVFLDTSNVLAAHK
jgi:hypothetical protein